MAQKKLSDVAEEIDDNKSYVGLPQNTAHGGEGATDPYFGFGEGGPVSSHPECGDGHENSAAGCRSRTIFKDE